ncbi:hypothetical protein [Flavisolibacter tropicus]|uniref:Uncharacterized protein n=1 Tax=Flavisolibacter tropicus TaxID=1492898 RepID=A0A172TWR3_9BACT|nr:hypothetical protein [Flavisolibacter tropicus]ANE51470.1 hypothetical protein SY85_14110 [Flavisolibacter tropicus]
MKQVIKLSALLFFMAFALVNCGKSSDDTTTPAESNLVISLDPDPGSSTTPVKATGSTYSFNVVIKSAVPPQGVTVKVDYVKDSGGSVFSETKTSTNATTSFTITNIPFNEVGTVTVVVTSISKPSNTATQTFKLVRK